MRYHEITGKSLSETTSAASVATSVQPLGGIGAGFDPNGHDRSIYPAPDESQGKEKQGKDRRRKGVLLKR